MLTQSDVAKWNAEVRECAATRPGTNQKPYLVERMGRNKSGAICRAAARSVDLDGANELARIAAELPRATYINVYLWDGSRWIELSHEKVRS